MVKIGQIAFEAMKWKSLKSKSMATDKQNVLLLKVKKGLSFF